MTEDMSIYWEMSFVPSALIFLTACPLWRWVVWTPVALSDTVSNFPALFPESNTDSRDGTSETATANGEVSRCAY